jgi:purine-nucleoside phosphorylase
MKLLGVEKLMVSNASGGVNPDFEVGDIMIIRDHINFMPEHPLRGENDSRFGPRFVDMHEPYNLEMIQIMKEVAQEQNIPVREGVYLALQGPTFETPAEYRMVKLVGADTVGMSTVTEVIVAKHMGMKCFGLSVITDLGIEGKIEPVSHEAVQEAAKASEEKINRLVDEFIKRC